MYGRVVQGVGGCERVVQAVMDGHAHTFTCTVKKERSKTVIVASLFRCKPWRLKVNDQPSQKMFPKAEYT